MISKQLQEKLCLLEIDEENNLSLDNARQVITVGVNSNHIIPFGCVYELFNERTRGLKWIYKMHNTNKQYCVNCFINEFLKE